MPRPLIYLLYVLITSAVFLAGRILYIVFNKNGNVLNNKSRVAKTLVVLGSGGHTTEILQIIKNLNLEQYTPRLYVHAHSDKISSIKVYEFENERQDFNIVTISRSREVGQSYFTSIWTTLVSFQDSLKIVWNFKPDLLLCNGPGTCVPICIAVFLIKVMFMGKTKIIFIESYCRVKSYSLSGSLLYYIVDHMIVQWPELYKTRTKHMHLIK